MKMNKMSNENNENNGPPVAVRNLRKAFGEQRVLDGINLNVASGETVAVLGRSGTGKSVLLKLIIRLQAPDSGSIAVAGRDMGNIDMNGLNEVRKKIGFLFQQAALYDSMSVADNVAFPLTRHAALSGADRRKRVQELLASVGMEEDMKKLPSQISGGMQKRVGLARALALDPEILLFDEPTAGLDPITAEEISGLIVDLKKKRRMSAIVVTHDVPRAKIFADRLVLLHEGKIRVEGTFAELQESRDEIVQHFLGETGR